MDIPEQTGLDIVVNFKFGSVGIEPDPKSPLYSFKVEKDEHGKETKRERFYSHYVCLGYEHCFKCGRKIG